MTLTINHPDQRHTVPVMPLMIGLALTVLVAVVALQVSGAFSSNDGNSPNSPGVQAPAVQQGPNVGLAPDWTNQQAAVAASSATQGPNAGLAPDWTSQHAARVAEAIRTGPNAGLAPDWTSQHAAAVAAGRTGPNTGLAPDWTAQK